MYELKQLDHVKIEELLRKISGRRQIG
jgi:hypothetical protein